LTLDRDHKRGPFDWDSFSISLPFTPDDGAYSVPGLPHGAYEVRIRHFDYPTHVYRGEKSLVTIPEQPNGRVYADFEVEAKQLYYGRAVFDDSKPVMKGYWIARFGGQQRNAFSLNLNEDGTFRVLLSTEEWRKADKYQKGMVQVSGYLSDQQRSTVDVALDKLSKDASKPTVVTLPARPPAEKPRPAKTPDDAAFSDGLAWISELKVLGDEKRTIELADFKGKPMYLNLLGSRNGEILPQLLALYAKYADRGLVILVICTDGSTEVEDLVKKYELPFTVAADVDGYAVDVFRRGRSEPGHPSNVVLNAQGERIFREVGFDGDKLNRLEAAIEQALAGSK
jgi:hypothetical protein